MSAGEVHRGACLCGAVRVEVAGALTPPAACHCRQCRKQSGHYGATTELARAVLAVTGEEHVRWYRSSAEARRGFCGICGSTLFWEPNGGEVIEVAMGLFDGPTGSWLARHSRTADAGDYYTIADDLPSS